MLAKPPPINWWESNSASLHQTQGASEVLTREEWEAATPYNENSLWTRICQLHEQQSEFGDWSQSIEWTAVEFMLPESVVQELVDAEHYYEVFEENRLAWAASVEARWLRDSA